MINTKGLMLATAAAALFASGASLAVEHDKAGRDRGQGPLRWGQCL